MRHYVRSRQIGCKPSHPGRPIVCVETKRPFMSVGHAAEWLREHGKDLGVAALYHAARDGRKRGGYHWRLAERHVA